MTFFPIFGKKEEKSKQATTPAVTPKKSPSFLDHVTRSVSSYPGDSSGTRAQVYTWGGGLKYIYLGRRKYIIDIGKAGSTLK